MGSTNGAVEEFYLSASEFCKMVELAAEIGKVEFISNSQKLLSLVYLKASLLEKPVDIADGEAEKFVQEEDWVYIKNNVAEKLGDSDKVIEIILPEHIDPENYESVIISDCFADIYQDLKDFITAYEIVNQDGINVSLFDCLLNFEKFWGARLLSVLSYLHNQLYSDELHQNNENNSNESQSNQNGDNSNWIINQRFNK